MSATDRHPSKKQEEKMLEKELEKYFVEQCTKKGYWCLKFTSPSTAGVPDRIVLTRFGTYFAELKRPKVGSLSRLQDATFKKLQKYGHSVVVIQSKEDVDRFVHNIGVLEKTVWNNILKDSDLEEDEL